MHPGSPPRQRPGASSIYAPQPEAEWLARHGQSRGGQLREDRLTLQGVGRAPTLSPQETDCLRDVLNAYLYVPEHVRALPILLAAEVEDSAPDGLADKWGVDLAALVARLRALHPADAWALLESVRLWWVARG
jgi:hypothetical protein